MWREEDEALLEHLRDESLLDRLWLHHTHNDAHRMKAPSPRAARMIACARELPGGARIAEEALTTGDATKLAALLDPPSLIGFGAELLHHLALFHARVADAIEPRSPEMAGEARSRSVAAWLALSERGALEPLARDIAANALGERELLRLVDEIPFEAIDDLGKRALAAAASCTREARASLRALARMKDACKRAGASSALTDRAVRRARGLRTAAIEAALRPLEEALSVASAAGHVKHQAGGILARAIPIWQLAEYDAIPEIFVVRHITDVAWEFYGASEWDALRGLLAPFWPMVDSLEQRMTTEKELYAYAASCAQMLVFRSELAGTMTGQIELAERALRVHPTHRNARLVLASYLCDQAIRALEKNPVYVRRGDLDEAAAWIARAEKLYPASKKLEPAKKKLDDARRRPVFPFGGTS